MIKNHDCFYEIKDSLIIFVFSVIIWYRLFDLDCWTFHDLQSLLVHYFTLCTLIFYMHAKVSGLCLTFFVLDCFYQCHFGKIFPYNSERKKKECDCLVPTEMIHQNQNELLHFNGWFNKILVPSLHETTKNQNSKFNLAIQGKF